jgi:serine phosphatase RsbU (regulator of sigma subunit)
MAGMHEEVVIYRAAQDRCERIAQSGVWIGITEDIQAETRDDQFLLDRGDVLLLYTDGLIEAHNANGEEFGIERVEQILRASARSSVELIQESLLAAVHAWTPVQQDDVTLMVARRT